VERVGEDLFGAVRLAGFLRDGSGSGYPPIVSMPPVGAPTSPRAAGRVLIVDDNVELVGTLQAILSRAITGERGETTRLEVVAAARGEEALAVARSQGFDVAIVDVKLPDTSGVDLIEPLRAASPFGEVVLITGFASMDAAIGALRSGAFAFILKSFRPEELISTVAQALTKVRLKRERRALEKRAADAEALSTMGTLAMNLAHEVRNPLNGAVLQLHLLERDIGKLQIEPETHGALLKRTEIVGAEIRRLNRLLTEFLDLARPRGIARVPVLLGPVVEEVLVLERDTAAGCGVSIERDFDGEGCTAMGDREKLKQVVLNLVVNALEAMKTGGTLIAKTAREGHRVVLTIEDTGAGIEPAHVSEVFEPFFTTKEGGTGLGLSIVRKIVDQHGGDVRIASQRGKGTRVTVVLPAAKAPPG
jgi:two-component system sensor histidine kinase HydH